MDEGVERLPSPLVGQAVVPNSPEIKDCNAGGAGQTLNRVTVNNLNSFRYSN